MLIKIEVFIIRKTHEKNLTMWIPYNFSKNIPVKKWKEKKKKEASLLSKTDVIEPMYQNLKFNS